MCLPNCPFCQAGIFGPAPKELVEELVLESIAQFEDECAKTGHPVEKGFFTHENTPPTFDMEMGRFYWG